MGRYVIKNSNTLGLKKLLSKYGSISIQTDKLEGRLKIVGYRKYLLYIWNDMISETDMYSKDSEVQLVNMVQNTHT